MIFPCFVYSQWITWHIIHKQIHMDVIMIQICSQWTCIIDIIQAVSYPLRMITIHHCNFNNNNNKMELICHFRLVNPTKPNNIKSQLNELKIIIIFVSVYRCWNENATKSTATTTISSMYLSLDLLIFILLRILFYDKFFLFILIATTTTRLSTKSTATTSAARTGIHFTTLFGSMLMNWYFSSLIDTTAYFLGYSSILSLFSFHSRSSNNSNHNSHR